MCQVFSGIVVDNIVFQPLFYCFLKLSFILRKVFFSHTISSLSPANVLPCVTLTYIWSYRWACQRWGGSVCCGGYLPRISQQATAPPWYRHTYKPAWMGSRGPTPHVARMQRSVHLPHPNIHFIQMQSANGKVIRHVFNTFCTFSKGILLTVYLQCWYSLLWLESLCYSLVLWRIG